MRLVMHFKNLCLTICVRFYLLFVLDVSRLNSDEIECGSLVNDVRASFSLCTLRLKLTSMAVCTSFASGCIPIFRKSLQGLRRKRLLLIFCPCSSLISYRPQVPTRNLNILLNDLVDFITPNNEIIFLKLFWCSSIIEQNSAI